MKTKQTPTPSPTEDTGAAADGHMVEIKRGTYTVLYMEPQCDCIIMDFAEMLNHGSLFADYCDLVVGLEGLNAVTIAKDIFDKIEELDIDESVLDYMLSQFQSGGQDVLHIELSNLDIRVRTSLSNTVRHYFQAKDNNFKVTKEAEAFLVKQKFDDIINSIKTKTQKGN